MFGTLALTAPAASKVASPAASVTSFLGAAGPLTVGVESMTLEPPFCLTYMAFGKNSSTLFESL